MLRGYTFKLTVASLAALIFFDACRKREEFSLPDNYVVFATDAQGISESENSITVNLKLTRPTTADISVVINIADQGAVYGTHYTTTPAATNGVLNLTLPSGNSEAAFTVNKKAGVLFEGTEKISFDLYSSGSPILIGATKHYTLSFSELVATNSAMTVNGGGTLFPNKVFIDLSANRQTAVLRTNWDLGFYTDPNDFKVVLNSSTGMMVKQLAKNDLTQVTAADTAGLSLELTYSSFSPSPIQLPYVDYPDGNMNKTAIGLISTTASDNKVFLVNRGTDIGSAPAPLRGWKKIRVLRNGSGGYTLQYADIAATTFSSIDIAKDDKYFFKYVSFDNGIVNIEPQKTRWDIAWCYFGYITGSPDPNLPGEVPFLYQDFVVQNRNVSIAQVLTSAKTYEAFSEADIAGQTFSTIQTTIGSTWRSTYPSAAVKADRFYIIKDGDGNYYKLKFTGMTDGGVRGYPSIAYELIKRG